MPIARLEFEALTIGVDDVPPPGTQGWRPSGDCGKRRRKKEEEKRNETDLVDFLREKWFGQNQAPLRSDLKPEENITVEEKTEGSPFSKAMSTSVIYC
ncbi:hypothetical protein FRC18_005657 [Serendipita sp. 400]|nr:hypothetical protein FRC18_005657 [Serendipita sp. 400]